MMWVWGVVNALLIMLVIYCNGRDWRAGWALGFAAQCWLILFGALGGGPWTFVFSTGPAIMFAVNWWLHPRRRARRLATNAAIVRMAVEASHEQPSPFLGPHLGMSGGEALANIDKFLTDFRATPRHAPLWPATWIHPWLYDEEPATRPADQEPPPGTAADKVDQVGHFYAYATGRSTDEPSVSTEQAMAIIAEYGGTPAQYLGHWQRITLHPALSAEEPATTPGPQPGMSTDILPATGHLGGPPKDPPGGCLLCPGGADVPQTELIEHLISHHPEVYDGSAFETWPVDDTTSQEGDHE